MLIFLDGSLARGLVGYIGNSFYSLCICYPKKLPLLVNFIIVNPLLWIHWSYNKYNQLWKGVNLLKRGCHLCLGPLFPSLHKLHTHKNGAYSRNILKLYIKISIFQDTQMLSTTSFPYQPRDHTFLPWTILEPSVSFPTSSLPDNQCRGFASCWVGLSQVHIPELGE